MDYYATTLVGKLVKIGGPSRIVFGTKSSTIRHIDHKFGMNVSKNVTDQHVIITCIYSVLCGAQEGVPQNCGFPRFENFIIAGSVIRFRLLADLCSVAVKNQVHFRTLVPLCIVFRYIK